MLPRFKQLQLIVATAAISILAACQPVAAPPAPTPQYAPRAPTPPFGASATTVVPPLRADGLRQTINRDIGPLETVWHVRSALNVAALSCPIAQYGRITDDYNLFLKKHKTFLARANRAIDAKYRRENGSGYRRVRDRKMTSLYNYWSFSPLRRPFCDKAMQVSQQAIAPETTDLEAFGASALKELEQPFNEFYLAYEQYERDLAAWRQQNGS